MKKVRCVLVGTGTRGISSYVKPIVNGHLSDRVELVGIYDAVKERAELCSADFGGIRVFDDFNEMLKVCRADIAIVTVKDAAHEEYIIKALESGYNVITEKPMTTTVSSAKRILDAEKKSGRWVRVIFNMRYMKPFCDIKSIIMSGKIGKVRHINLEWRLDRSHGADYFRRWHRYLENTNSLLVHKSTHHFDILNWLISGEPSEVFANCTLEFYGKNGSYRGECCHKCEHTAECPFYVDVTKDDFKKRYFYELEEFSGYYRDGCVFDEKIDIFDRMAVSVKYKNSVTVNYSLIAYSIDEGFTISVLGEEGRLELAFDLASEENKYGLATKPTSEIKLITADGVSVLPTGLGEGDHGGADDLMREQIFFEDENNDPLSRRAGAYDGCISLAIGDLAVKSNSLGKKVKLSSYLV